MYTHIIYHNISKTLIAKKSNWKIWSPNQQWRSIHCWSNDCYQVTKIKNIVEMTKKIWSLQPWFSINTIQEANFLWSPFLWWPKPFTITIHAKATWVTFKNSCFHLYECIKIDIDVMPDAKLAHHIHFDNMFLFNKKFVIDKMWIIKEHTINRWTIFLYLVS
jgi:hypothetical protein